MRFAFFCFEAFQYRFPLYPFLDLRNGQRRKETMINGIFFNIYSKNWGLIKELTQINEPAGHKQAFVDINLKIEQSKGGEHLFQRRKMVFEGIAEDHNLTLIDQDIFDFFQHRFHCVLQGSMGIFHASVEGSELKFSKV